MAVQLRLQIFKQNGFSLCYQSWPVSKGHSTTLRWLNTVLAVFEYRSFAKLWQEKGCSSQVEIWQVKNIMMKDFD